MIEPLSPRSSPRATWTRRLAGLLIFAAMVYLVHRLVAEVGWSEVGERLAAARLGLLGLAVACLAGQLATWSVRQRMAIRRIRATPPGWTIFLALVATAAANFLLPFARLVGGLLRARYLSRTSEPPTQKRIYYGAVLFDQAVHFLVMGALTVVGLVGGALILGRPGLAVGIAATALVLVTVATLWIRRRVGAAGGGLVRFLERRAERREGPVGRLLAGSGAAAGIFLRLARDRSLWTRTAPLGVAVFAFVAGAQWTVFRALGTDVHPLLVVGTVALGLSAGVLLGTPGGLGTTEATMIALYGAFGVDRVDAASAVLLFRGLQFGVVLGLGLPAMAVLELYAVRVGRRRREEVEEEEPLEEVGR